MATMRSGWIGWWIVTGALLALIALAIGCDPRSTESPEDLLRNKDGQVDGDPPPPPPPGPMGGGVRGGGPTPVVDRGGGGSRGDVGGTTKPPRHDNGDGWSPPPLGSRSSAPQDVLREVHWAQKQFIKAIHVDEDHDGFGEYGGLSELSRATGGRMGRPIPAPLIQRELGQLNQHGEGRLGDYHYRVWLPGRYGIGIGELWGGAGAAQFEPNLAEDYWICYAWPARGVTGPVYFTSQDGRLLMTDDPRYAGAGNGPRAGSALRRGEIEDMLAPPATNGTGLDGNTWRTAR